VHGLNVVFLLVELLLNSLPLRPASAIFVTWWALLYAAFSFLVWYPFTHSWVYFFMDTGTIMIVPWITG
jgi:hypothetical protein